MEGKSPATIVYRDALVLAFHDLHPVAPVHILLIPIKHIDSLSRMQAEDEALGARLLAVARELAGKEGLDRDGYRLVLNTGPGAGQSVQHLHLHLLGGRQMHWPPG